MNEILNVGNKFLNRYLLPIDDGYCLLDTGYKWEYEEFIEKLAKLHIGVEQIKYVVLTHMHADHAGFAKELLTHVAATLIYDVSDKRRLEAGKNNFNTYISSFSALICSKASAVFVDKMQCFPAVFYDKYINSHEQPLLQYGIEFVSLKGHTECDLCIKYEGKLFCGDICMSGIGAVKHAPMWIYNKYDMLESWRTIAAMDDVTEIYPAHGKPFKKADLTKCIEYWKDKGVFRLFGKSNY